MHFSVFQVTEYSVLLFIAIFAFFMYYYTRNTSVGNYLPVSENIYTTCDLSFRKHSQANNT